MLSSSIAACLLSAAPDAEAIAIRDDVADARYVVADADYPALVDLFEPGDCIGSLIHESFLLTVAHCAVDLRVGQSLVVDGAAVKVAEVILHPSWKDLDAFDIALVRLESPVTTIVPLPIYRDELELGATVALVGRGVTATGLQGEEGAVSDGALRRATNQVSAVNDHFLEIIFEREGEPNVTELEGVGVAGDSGCPVFVDVDGVPTIAGLNSYGDEVGNAGVGQYGSRDYQTRVSQYLSWLDDHLDASAEPEPPPADQPDDSDDGSGDALGGCSITGNGTTGGVLLLLFVVTGWRRRPLASSGGGLGSLWGD